MTCTRIIDTCFSPGQDGRAREQIIERHMPLARRLARRYHTTWESQEDVEQVAYLALIQAADAFDFDRGTAFSSYAVPCIVGAIKRYFRDHSWAVRVPRHLQELALRIQRLDDQLYAGHGRRPTAAELAEASGVDVEQVLEAREARRALRSESLDQPPRAAEDQDTSLIETLGETDVELDRVVDRAALDAALAQLDERARLIVQLYYHEELTQAEIGKRLGCSQMQISRLIRAAVAQMRRIVPGIPAAERSTRSSAHRALVRDRCARPVEVVPPPAPPVRGSFRRLFDGGSAS